MVRAFQTEALIGLGAWMARFGVKLVRRRHKRTKIGEHSPPPPPPPPTESKEKSFSAIFIRSCPNYTDKES